MTALWEMDLSPGTVSVPRRPVCFLISISLPTAVSYTHLQLGKITVIEGVDPNARLMTGGGAGEDEDEEINFCVATVRKSDLVK